MNITFFIGNGFDLNLGLKTKYSDFYPYFLENSSEDNIIKEWLKEDEMLWADLEESLGEHLKKISENDLEKFYEDKIELDQLLMEYMDKENQSFEIKDNESVKNELIRSMRNSFINLSKEEQESIAYTQKVYRNEFFYYQFVSFNYTHTIDKIVDTVPKDNRIIGKHQNGAYNKEDIMGEVFHIHGTTKGEMILGVNDANQLNNKSLISNEEFLDTIIKSRANKAIGQQKTETVKNLINDSHIICIFGMSLGNTDKIWWEEIIDWLLKNKNNKLVIFWKGYEDVFERKIPTAIIRTNNKIKRELLKKGKANKKKEDLDSLMDRIMISYNTKIFDFKRENETEKKDTKNYQKR